MSSFSVRSRTTRTTHATRATRAILAGVTAAAFLAGTVGCTTIPDEVWDTATEWSLDQLIIATDPERATNTGAPYSAATGLIESDLTASETLQQLRVAGRAPKHGYDREQQFGNAWADVDRNGCDTRNDVLLRDLTDTTADDRCRILTGTLADPFTGQLVPFTRGEQTSADVQIDHVVSLSDAWQTGAQALTEEQRVRLANDPLNLLAVDGPTNAAKSDSNAASWLPPNRDFRCHYVARQISVKDAYQLWVLPAEYEAMERVLSTCPEQPAYRSVWAVTE